MVALGGLSEADIARLLKFADWRALGVGGSGGDLLGDAVARTLEMKRQWRRGISLENHLLASIRSIAHSHLKRELRSVELKAEHPALPTDPENAIDAAEMTKRLYREFESKGDTDAIKVMTSILEGLKPKEALIRYNMEDDTYLAARLRIRREARKLLAGRGHEGSHA
jgi:DNA-directed RNA polymerase specialized sigma24 family protein